VIILTGIFELADDPERMTIASHRCAVEITVAVELADDVGRVQSPGCYRWCKARVLFCKLQPSRFNWLVHLTPDIRANHIIVSPEDSMLEQNTSLSDPSNETNGGYLHMPSDNESAQNDVTSLQSR
jgi:hypothetical protein